MAVPRRAAIPLVLAILAATSAGGYYVFNRSAVDPGVIRLSGNIEVTDAEVSFKIPGRVEKRPVDEGQTIKKGDVVAVLDSADLEAEVAMRRAELRLAEAAEKELRSSRPEEIEAAYAAWQQAEAAYEDLKAEAGSREYQIRAAEAALAQAKAEYERRETDYGRAAQLYKNKTISHEEYDRAETAFEVAREQLRQATENLNSLQSSFRERETQADWTRKRAKWEYELVKLGPRKEKHEQALARKDQAAEALRLAEIRLDYATLKSPLGGVVLTKNIEPGEYVAPGTPVVTVADLERPWLRAYINETDLGRVKLGQEVTLRTDTYPDKTYQGRVSFISSEAEFTPKSVQTPKERVKLVYRIKIDVVANPNMELLPGMPADAEIVVE